MKRYLLWVLFCCYAALAQAEPDGQQLYAQNCAACHGKNGNGGVGVPLALPDFQSDISDRFLANTIRHGRPGRVMPAFNNLTDAEVNALVKHIRSWVPEQKQSRGDNIKVRPGNPAKGEVLFKQNCVACHGEHGEGGHGTGVTFSRPRDLPIIAPALNNSGFLASADDRMIKSTLMHGRANTPMVSFLKQGLSEKDIDDIVSYIRSWEANPYDRQQALSGLEETYITLESPYDLKKTVANVEKAALGKNFRIIRIQTLEQGLVEKDKENPKQVIVYFCNFQFLNDALAVDPRVGLFLPCRVTVTERNGTVEVSTINPKYLSRLFNNVELNKLCDGMHALYMEILEESTL